MSERSVILDQPVLTGQSSEALHDALTRAERAEAELARLKSTSSDSTKDAAPAVASPEASAEGLEELRREPMMAHLLDSLAEGKDIGHYGRLVFCMVARHFLPASEIVSLLAQDRDFSEEQAASLLHQVETHNYNPPRRDRILEWQSQQDFPLLPSADPDCGNVYRTLRFPDGIFKNIEHYQEEKMEASH